MKRIFAAVWDTPERIGMKKKFFGIRSFLLIISVCVTLAMSGCGEMKGSQQMLEMDDSLLAQVTDICGGEKSFYIVTVNDIIKYSEDGKLTDSFHFDDRAISCATYGDALYALDCMNQELIKLDKKGEIVETLPLDMEFHEIQGISAYEQIVYLNCSVLDENGVRDIVYRIDMETQKIEEFLETFGYVYADRSEEGYLLVASGEVFCGGVDSEEEPYLEKYSAPGTKIRALTRDEKGRKLYFVRDNRVYLCGNEGLELLHSLEIAPQKIAAAGVHLLLLELKKGLVLATMAADESTDVVTLNLYNIDDSYVDGQTYVNVGYEFESKYNIQLDYRQESVLAYDRFLYDILSGSDKYDIYMVSNMKGNSTGYKKNHAYYDLSGSEILTGAVREMYDSVSASAWNGEELFGIPIDVDGEVLCYNPDAYPEYGADNYAEWDDVLDVIEEEDRGRIYNLHSGRIIGGILNQYLMTYGKDQSGKYTFDTPEFKETLKLMKRTAEMELPSAVSSSEHHYETVLAQDEIFGWVQLSEYVRNPIYPIAAPGIDGEEGKCQVYQMFAVVNPNSKHKEEAIRYLEYLCQTGRIQGNPLLYAEEEKPEIVDFMENRMVSSFEWKIDQAKIYSVVWQYLRGGMSEEELIVHLTERVNMQ